MECMSSMIIYRLSR